MGASLDEILGLVDNISTQDLVFMAENNGECPWLASDDVSCTTCLVDVNRGGPCGNGLEEVSTWAKKKLKERGL